MKKKITSTHLPSYIGVYNSLYSDITNGVYAVNEQLPSETHLSEKYGVSRNTLRQALAILSEDGLIQKSQGKGTIVTSIDTSLPSSKIFNPMTTLCKQTIDAVDITYNYASPTEIALQKLGLVKSDLVLAGTSIYHSGNTAMGYSFLQIPVSLLKDFDVDVSDESSIEDLLNQSIFHFSSTCSIHIKSIYATEIEASFLNIKADSPLLLIESILYGQSKYPIARCKYYFIPDYYTLQFLF